MYGRSDAEADERREKDPINLLGSRPLDSAMSFSRARSRECELSSGFSIGITYVYILCQHSDSEKSPSFCISKSKYSNTHHPSWYRLKKNLYKRQISYIFIEKPCKIVYNILSQIIQEIEVYNIGDYNEQK